MQKTPHFLLCSATAVGLIFLFHAKKTLAQAQCDEEKCTRQFPITKYSDFNRCYAPSGLWGCSCEEGYMAVVLEDDIKSPPFHNSFVRYTCCRSDDEVAIKESLHCGDYHKLENEADFEDCTIDECEDIFGSCFVRSDRKCTCSSGYTAKLTGRAIPVVEDSLYGVVLLHDYECCPSDNIIGSDEIEVYSPGSCGKECLEAEVCFKDLGCFVPENADEFKGCTSKMCQSDGGIFMDEYCVVMPGDSCPCGNGLVAKPTGRTKENSNILEYVCCPPGTPGTEKGDDCNPRSDFRFIYAILAFDAFILILLIIQLCRQRKNELSSAAACNREKNPLQQRTVDASNQDCNVRSLPKSTDSKILRSELLALKERMQHLITEVDEKLILCASDDNDKRIGDTLRENLDGGTKSYIATQNNDNDFSKNEENQESIAAEEDIPAKELYLVANNSSKDTEELVSGRGDFLPENQIIPQAVEDCNEIKACNSTEEMKKDLRGGQNNQFENESQNIKQNSESIGVLVSRGGNKELETTDNDNAVDDVILGDDVDSESFVTEIDDTRKVDERILERPKVEDSFVSGFHEEEICVTDKDEKVEKHFYRTGEDHDVSVASDEDDSLFQGLLSTFSREKRGGIHEFYLYHATKIPEVNSTNCIQATMVILSPLLSWAVLLFQLLILYLILLETQYPKCSTSGGCGVGSYCDNDTGFCEEVDPHAPCSRMVDLSPLPTVSLFASVFIYLFIIHGVIKDLEKNVRLDKAATFRYDCIRMKHHFLARWWIKAHVWGLYYVRGYVLPTLVFGASIAIFYAEEDGFMVAKVVLNGVAIIFISEFDQVVCDLLVTYRTQHTISEEMERAFIEEIRMVAVHQTRNIEFLAKEDRSLHMWWLHRLMCFFMATISLITIENPVKLSLFYNGTADCDMLLGLTVPLFVTGICFAAFDNFVKGLKSWKVALANFFFSQVYLIFWIFVFVVPIGYFLNGNESRQETIIQEIKVLF